MEHHDIATRDIRLAAFLLARGHRLVQATRESGTSFFHFARTPQLKDDVDDLNHGDDLISASALFGAQARLKRIIFEENFA